MRLTKENVALIRRRATDGFVLEPDHIYEEKWTRCVNDLVENLRRRNEIEKATMLIQQQQKMSEHRKKVLDCKILDMPGDADALVITDGINVGRFSFKEGTRIANAWVDSADHDVYVVRRMLEVLCKSFMIDSAMIEGSGRYKKWIENESNSFPAVS
jgi:hypothetical protein